MNRIHLSLLFIFVTTYAFGQCPAPEVNSWHFSDSVNVDIAFYADDAAESYEAVFTVLFNDSIAVLNERDTLTGDVENGMNTLSYNVVDLLSAANINSTTWFWGLRERSCYYRVDIRTTCGDNDWSEFTTFYVSPFSLFNDPGFSFVGELKMPFLSFPDSVLEYTVVQFEIPEQSPPELVEQVEVFIDFGHPNLNIGLFKITSPSGTVVILRPFENPETTSPAFGAISYNYTNDALLPVDSSGYGIVLPFESLAAFNGEMASGTWTVSVQNTMVIWQGNGLLSGGRTFGVGLSVETSPIVASIAGSTFYDFNGNGINDGNDLPFSYALIDDTGIQTSFSTNINGDFTNDMAEGEGALSVLNTPLYYESIPASLPYSVFEGDYITGFDFAITPIVSFNNLTVDMWSILPDRPGFENNYTVHYENIGTTCIDDVYIDVELDNILEIISVNAADYSIDGNTITINLGTICPTESGTFHIQHYLNSSVSLGTILSTSTTIYPMDGDENEFNNILEFNSVVVGSYDPNDKQVSSETIDQEFLTNSEPLKYLVRFQNTGTYLAENVVVTDTLDENLDMSTFHMVSTSHDMNITVEGRVLHFNFNDIMLPDSASDLEASNGFLRYRIAPYSNLTHGMVIENTAYIYFDFNEAIITNTSETLVDFSLSIDQNDQYVASLYPNPANSAVTLSWSNVVDVNRLLIFDMRGKQVLARRVSNNQTNVVIDISHLARGTYVMQLIGDAQIKPVRLVKM